jgi:phosphopantothenoylcysteine decarboxylase / phosphopantothenate---cysteine ligase
VGVLRVLITTGPTQEPIDPIRFISNHSSGKMGYCLAEAFIARGAHVILISGPTHLTPPDNLEKFINVTTAQEMLEQVLANMKDIDIMISAAAIADYRVTQYSNQKIKKADASLNLELAKNPDLLKTIRAKYPNVFLVGFALETENLLANAQRKLHDKKLDMIIANQVTDNNPIFNTDENSIIVLQKGGESMEYVRCSKTVLAEQLVNLISAHKDRST